MRLEAWGEVVGKHKGSRGFVLQLILCVPVYSHFWTGENVDKSCGIKKLMYDYVIALARFTISDQMTRKDLCVLKRCAEPVPPHILYDINVILTINFLDLYY